METSLIVLLFAPILLANTLTASILRNGGEVACDPAANPSDCPSNRRCEDIDGDGQSTCVCDSRFYKTNAAGNCVLGLKELIYEMEKEIETLKANVSDNANDIASNEAQISMNAANITAADDQVNMEAMDEMKDKLDALNQSLSGDLDQAMMDLEELELKQQEDINWLNDTMNELLMLPTTTREPCPGNQTYNIEGVCTCPGGTVHDGNGNCGPCEKPENGVDTTLGEGKQNFRGASVINDKCYMFSQSDVKWTTALEMCTSLNGKLFEPRTLEENIALCDKGKHFFGNQGMWLGISTKGVGQGGTFVYESDSTPVPFQNWVGDNPVYTHDCVYMHAAHGATHGKWYAAYWCDDLHHRRYCICEF